MMNYTNILQETRNYMLRLNQIILIPYTPANHLQPIYSSSPKPRSFVKVVFRNLETGNVRSVKEKQRTIPRYAVNRTIVSKTLHPEGSTEGVARFFVEFLS